MILAPIYEYIGYKRNDLRYDRFSRSLIWFSLVIFSPGAALGTGIPMIIIGLYPEFWARWSNLFFWPLIIQFVFFLLEVVFLFFAYYLVWDRMNTPKKKRLHIFFGAIAAMWGLLIQFVWDGVGAYMLTPNGAELPNALNPVGWSAQAFFNPSLPYLFLHRFFGNISYTILLVGGVFAIKYMRAKDPVEHKYYAFSSDLSFSVGFLAFFAQPFIGWGYSTILEKHAPVAFNAIMGGHASQFFVIKMILICVFVAIAGTYVFVRHREKTKLLITVTVLLAAVFSVVIAHPPLRGFPGGAVGWRAATIAAVLGFMGFLWWMRAKALPFSPARKRWPRAMFVAGIAAFLVFALGGFTRERARSPYTVYGELVKPEAKPYEKDRYLVYENCTDEYTLPQLRTLDISGWESGRILDTLCADGTYTEEQGERIVKALKEGRI